VARLDVQIDQIQNGSMDPIRIRGDTIMPVNLSIKQVPDALADRLRERAARNGRSLQRELMTILEQSAAAPSGMSTSASERPGVPERGLAIEEVAAWARAQFPAGTPSSVELIRSQRDVRHGADRNDAATHRKGGA
jgi:plasmid stability protein